jgi:hypothetical protein
MYDRTHLANFADLKTEWPQYITIGNVSSKLRQRPSTHSVIIITLLPILMKKGNIPQQRLGKQLHTNKEVLNVVLRPVFQSLHGGSATQHPIFNQAIE